MLDVLDSQVLAQAVHLFDEKVNVHLGDRLIGDDAPEEVGQLSLRLVANHESAGCHHAALEYRCNLPEYKTVFSFITVDCIMV